MDEITYTPIGIIHSPFKETKGAPIQAAAAKVAAGTVEVFPQYARGLKDVDGFSHLILVCHFHLSRGVSLEVVPYMDDERRGVFATRSPRRPNPIGISIVRLTAVEDNLLHIKGVDIIDGTPLLDIKPYVPKFDKRDTDKIGWLKNRIHNLDRTRDDGRFT